MQVKGIFSYINERGTSPSDCKYKHMLENGAPPVKFGVLCCLLHRGPTEIHGFNNNIDMVNTLRFLVLSQFFADSMGPLKDWVTYCSPILVHYTVALTFAIPHHGHNFSCG